MTTTNPPVVKATKQDTMRGLVKAIKQSPLGTFYVLSSIVLHAVPERYPFPLHFEEGRMEIPRGRGVLKCDFPEKCGVQSKILPWGVGGGVCYFLEQHDMLTVSKQIVMRVTLSNYIVTIYILYYILNQNNQ